MLEAPFKGNIKIIVSLCVRKRENISKINRSRHSLNFFSFKDRHSWTSSLFIVHVSPYSVSSRVGDATFLKRVFHYHFWVFLSSSDTDSAHFDVYAQAMITIRTAPWLTVITRCSTILDAFEYYTKQNKTVWLWIKEKLWYLYNSLCLPTHFLTSTLEINPIDYSLYNCPHLFFL